MILKLSLRRILRISKNSDEFFSSSRLERFDKTSTTRREAQADLRSSDESETFIRRSRRRRFPQKPSIPPMSKNCCAILLLLKVLMNLSETETTKRVQFLDQCYLW